MTEDEEAARKAEVRAYQDAPVVAKDSGIRVVKAVCELPLEDRMMVGSYLLEGMAAVYAQRVAPDGLDSVRRATKVIAELASDLTKDKPEMLWTNFMVDLLIETFVTHALLDGYIQKMRDGVEPSEEEQRFAAIVKRIIPWDITGLAFEIDFGFPVEGMDDWLRLTDLFDSEMTSVGLESASAGIGFGYRDMQFSAPDRETWLKAREVVERLLTENGFKIHHAGDEGHAEPPFAYVNW